MYPILEFDSSPTAKIEPSTNHQKTDMPEHCVICFFRDVIEKVIEEQNPRVLVQTYWEDGAHPVYEISRKGKRLAFFHPGVGAPLAVTLLEVAIAYGCTKFIACGGCGVLQRDMPVGHLVILSGAVRDEGVSYHYLPPAREVMADQQVVQKLESEIQKQGVPYQIGKTWTTDALYRETDAKIMRRRKEGCLVVEMEAAGMMAVAQFRKVLFGQVVYGGDDLSGEEWDNRGWQSRHEVRENLFWLTADACLSLQ